MNEKQALEAATRIAQLCAGHREAGGDGIVRVVIEPYAVEADGQRHYELEIREAHGDGLIVSETLKEGR